MGGISIWQLLIIALVVILLFGSKRLRGLGSDLGEAMKGFKKAVSEDDVKGADNKDADFAPDKLHEQRKASSDTVETSKHKD